MLLAKSCFAKDHIENRKTIRLGSLYEYRVAEDEQIADRHEGKLNFTLKFDSDVTVDRKWFNAFTQGAIHYGPADDDRYYGFYEAYFECLNSKYDEKEGVTIRGGASAVIEQQYHNNFIFCMSLVSEKNEAFGIFPKYDAYWYVDESKCMDFGQHLGFILYQHIVAEHAKGNFLVPQSTDISKLTVYLSYGKVMYIPREIHITDDKVIDLDDLTRRMQMTPFTKPPDPFEVEKEVRFCYVIESNGQLIEPIKNSVILDAQPLLQYLIEK